MTTIIVQDVRKTFGRTIALAGADLELRSGEIVGIAGPNGAGKSTLTRILAGEEVADSGSFTLDGSTWNPRDDAGIVAVVHQESQLWPNLTVSENLVLGRETWAIGSPRIPERARQVLRELDLEDVSSTALEHCSLAVRQRVEIGRAMVRDARCYIFDEPNSALTDAESQSLFAFMHELAGSGHVIVIISHRLQELVEHCSRVCVVRDGVVAATLTGSALTESAIAAELVVDQISENEAKGRTSASSADPGNPLIDVRGWTSTSGHFDDIDLQAWAGEVVAVVGVEGSGARELTASLAGFSGARPLVGFDPVRPPDRATAYLPADRKEMLFHNLSVAENLVARLGPPSISLPRSGVLRRGQINRLAEDSIEQFRIRTRGGDEPIAALSGGNQQKVAIAAALTARPRLLVIQEATRGVDIGSKAEIHRILREAAAEGIAVIAFCTEFSEAYELADRLIVVDRGRIVLDERVAEFTDMVNMAEVIATVQHSAVETSSRSIR